MGTAGFQRDPTSGEFATQLALNGINAHKSVLLHCLSSFLEEHVAFVSALSNSELFAVMDSSFDVDVRCVQRRLTTINRYFDLFCGMEVMTAVRAANISHFSHDLADDEGCFPWLYSNVFETSASVTRLNRLSNSTLRTILAKFHPSCVCS
jgi:hypothetical protein